MSHRLTVKEEIYISVYPQDNPERKKGTRARSIIPSKFDSDHWEWHEFTGTDRGIDMVFELVEDNEFRGYKIDGQIKGRSNLKYNSGRTAIAFDFDVKTVNYGLADKNAYVLFLVDLETEDAYYLPIQDYFIANPCAYERLEANTSSLRLYIPVDNRIGENDYELCQIAKSVYVDGPGIELKKIR